MLDPKVVARLVREIKQGDNVNENVAALAEDFGPFVADVGHRYGNPQEKADLAADTAYLCWTTALKHEGKAPFRGWLYNRARTQHQHELKRKLGWRAVQAPKGKKKTPPRVYVGLNEEMIEAIPNFPLEIELLQYAISQLDESDRAFVRELLRHDEQRQAARALGRSDTYVSTTLHSVIVPKLRAIIEQELGRTL